MIKVFNNMPKSKIKLIRRTATLLAVTSLATLLNSTTYQTVNIPYTEEDLRTNPEIVEYIENIGKQDISFSNRELQEIIESQIGEPVTKENINTIENIVIDKTLSNSSLKDLEQFTSLKNLHIRNNDVDFNDIKYNQNIMVLFIDNCIVKNTSNIPNSVIYFSMFNSRCLDELFCVPYFTRGLNIYGSSINNIRLKTTEYLEELDLSGTFRFDLKTIEECTNLKELNIIRMPNIINAEVLRNMPALEKVYFDDYAPIWLDKETLESLNIDEKEKNELIREIEYLDNIILELGIDENTSIEDKNIKIITYILNKLTYDPNVRNDLEDLTQDLTINYNKYPIKYSIETDVGICVNYACLYTALINRVGIPNYQMYSNDHTWNVYGENLEKGMDLTALDNEEVYVKSEDTLNKPIEGFKQSQDFINNGLAEDLYFYNFKSSEDFYEGIDLKNIFIKDEGATINIGYISDDSSIVLKVKINNLEAENRKVEILAISQIFLMLIVLAYLKDKKKEIQETYSNEEHDETFLP